MVIPQPRVVIESRQCIVSRVSVVYLQNMKHIKSLVQHVYTPRSRLPGDEAGVKACSCSFPSHTEITGPLTQMVFDSNYCGAY